MSELEVYRFLGQDEVWPDANLGSDYYLKSEADKVIARHKYKRCFDKAKWCKLWYEQEKYEGELKDAHHWFRMSLYDKWHRRWLKLAEKFKEAK